MQKRRLGRTDIEVPILCLGTMMMGEQIDEPASHAQMDFCFERGLNFFDTAEMYTIPPKPETQGESERLIGRWAAAKKNRDQMIIATKISGRVDLPWIRDGEECRLSRDQIIRAVERSLKNLQTDYIDIYQTHWPDRRAQMFGSSLYGYVHYDEPGIAIEETLRAMEELVRAGKIRHAGVSNETAYGVMRHVNAAEEQSLPRIVSIQNAYSLINRTFESGLAEIAIEEGVGLLAYSPLAQGNLTGKYLGGAVPKGSRRDFMDRMQRYQQPNVEAAIARYVGIANDFGVAPAAFAMAFVNSRPFLTSNIFGANGLDQLQVIFDSLEVNWTDEMERAVNKAFAEFQSPAP